MNANKIAIIADQNAMMLFPNYFDKLWEGIPKFVFSVLPGESNKSIEEATYLWRNLQNNHFDANSLIVNFGGGKVTDLGGFVASTYHRGIPFINVPTTLLGMIDAAIGGKNGVNLEQVKNAVGTFCLPQDIIIDPIFLKTLPPYQLLNGFGEMIKYALIGSQELWNEIKSLSTIHYYEIKKEWIDFCIDFKKKIVAKDPYDQNLRHILNFGHTVGHAIESLCMAKNRPIAHGHAVALGIIAEAHISAHCHQLSFADYEEIKKVILSLYQFNDSILQRAEMSQLMDYISLDKKNNDNLLNFSLLDKIGQASYNHYIEESHCREAVLNMM